MAKRLSATPQSDHNPRSEPGDNSAAVEEASRVQFLSIMSQYDMALGELEVAQGPVKLARKKITSITGLAKSAGIPKWRLEQRHAEMARSTIENAEHIAAEARERRWAGIITPEQLAMHMEKSTPEEVVDASDWRSAGYKAGVLNRAATLPEGMPARYSQDFLGGHEDGRKSYMLTLAKNAPKPRGSKAEEIAADANAILEKDAIDEAAKKLAADPKFMERGEPEEGFEATPEELAAQKLRPSVQEAEEPVL